ncbi:nitroreductase family deazaflavin-dependent oxidoreductase [Saccharomonospora sp. NPDC046836]|uniref:nitroreductase family deazaflavin-dependent oxidoreductase n=1 Tax=Saccharomonospora sp. NPDC046836 TaxID=3156921 RepID=UPI003405A79A
MPLSGEYEPSTRGPVRDQVELYERTDGAEGNALHGLPIVVLTTVGKRSGKLRKSPVMRVEHHGRYLVVASLGGAPTSPSWYHNIMASPLVELQDGPVRKDYACKLLSGTERELWWRRAVEAFPQYAAYQARTTREIPLVLLEAS